jgi:hypothetical protein
VICKLCRQIVAVDTLSKTPSAKVHFAKVTDARPCPCKEAVDPYAVILIESDEQIDEVFGKGSRWRGAVSALQRIFGRRS